ncbi:hypothetical protein FOZ61_000806 [Perkinsus olseni]|uniref:CCHC-type domain-containing protein n=1 Tax=Perkinsus olseni TaxID=32597 RepID=A0A7J6KTK0_PEROL|nr:hypothetical protein FOZ61_000806 [Perkinsus olseni]
MSNSNPQAAIPPDIHVDEQGNIFPKTPARPAPQGIFTGTQANAAQNGSKTIKISWADISDDDLGDIKGILASLRGRSASSFNASTMLDLVSLTFNLLPDKYHAVGQEVLQLLSRHYLSVVENLGRGSILRRPSPSGSVSNVGPSSSGSRTFSNVVEGNAAKRSRSGDALRAPRVVKTPSAQHRAALSKAKKANQSSCVIEVTPNTPIQQDAKQFATFREKLLAKLDKSISVTSCFPLRDGGMGIVLENSGDQSKALASLSNLRNYKAKVRKGLWPRIIIFNCPVARGIRTEALQAYLKEANPELCTELGSDSETIISGIYWRGNHLCCSTSPLFYKALASRGEGVGKIKCNRLLCRWGTVKMPPICYRCSAIGHIAASCPGKDSPPVCTRCGKDHERQHCDMENNVPKCHNCSMFNEKCREQGREQSRPTLHEATSMKCPSSLAFMRKILSRTDFGGVGAPQEANVSDGDQAMQL